jgi:hypothetical protein
MPAMAAGLTDQVWSTEKLLRTVPTTNTFGPPPVHPISTNRLASVRLHLNKRGMVAGTFVHGETPHSARKITAASEPAS